eukprot:TRINITY_DN61265_c0_g1_i1.p1 TRINITY_DN61265_c0_g1~~TRINITY_DN61265_c0_g1_i1.p1  ORF type:complete len:542 (+),score=167.66 TRINITY_DN61265_c0_g1_i1:82-1626(+)
MAEGGGTVEADAKLVDVRLTDAMMERFVSYPGKVVVKVRPSGLKRTRMSVLQAEIDDIERHGTVADVLRATERARARWMAKDCFSDVRVLGPAPSSEGGGLFFMDVAFREANSTSLGVFMDAQAQAPEIRFTRNNLLGRGYTGYFEAQSQASTQGGEAAEAAEGVAAAAQGLPNVHFFPSFRAGLRSSSPWLGDWAEYSARRQRPYVSRNEASDETILEGGTQVGFSTGPLQHTVGLGSEWRTLKAGSEAGERSLRAAGEGDSLGDSQAHSLSWAASIDRRSPFPDPAARERYPHPAGGWAAWASLRASGAPVGLAGPGGVDAVRWEAKLHKLFSLGNWLALSCAGRAAGVHCAGDAVPRLNDRLYIESDVVRGYKRVGAVIPSAQGAEAAGAGRADAGLRGADLLLAGSLSLSCPLAAVVPRGMFAVHAFVNAGTAAMRPRGGERFSEQKWEAALQAGSAASCGVGLVVTAIPIFGTMGRLELNAAAELPVGSVTSGRGGDFQRYKFGLNWAL